MHGENMIIHLFTDDIKQLVVKSGLLLIAILFVLYSSVCRASQAEERIIENANKGEAKAQYRLSLMYAAGDGVQQDYAAALELTKKSANQGYLEAQVQLGEIFGLGLYGLSKNYSESFKWYSKAADQGYSLAFACLGGMYEDGKGVQKNYAKAYSLYSVAIKLGFWPAKDHLSALKKKMTIEQINAGEKLAKSQMEKVEKRKRNKNGTLAN